MTRAWTTAVLFLAGLLTACLPKVERPQVWLDGARLASMGLNGGVVDVRLSVYNPNSFDLRASGLTYDLAVEDGDGWVDFTRGEVDRELTVRSGDTVQVSVPVEFSYNTVGRVVGRLLDRGEFNYRVSGVVALEGPVRRDIDYRHTGTVTSSGLR